MVMFSIIITCKRYKNIHWMIMQSVYRWFQTCPMMCTSSTQCWLLLATNQCCIPEEFGPQVCTYW